MNKEELKARWVRRLDDHIPKNTSKTIANWIVELGVTFVISKPRATKLGDFRPPFKGKPARISINSDLNPFQFLLTTIHEFAHLGCYLQHGNEVKPHGKEWKAEFKKLLKPFVVSHVFPDEILLALEGYLKNPKASSCSSLELNLAMSKYDKMPSTLLLELQNGGKFEFRNVAFEVIEKRRTRFLCRNLANSCKYLISGSAKVKPL